MKLGPVTKLDKKNKSTSEKFGNDVMSGKYDVIVIFLIYVQFGAIRKPDSGRKVCKTKVLYISDGYYTEFNIITSYYICFKLLLILF